MSLDLNKYAVVTGGGTGIGRAVAAELRSAGFRVIITGRRRDVLEQTAKELECTAVSFDATDPAAVEAAATDLPDRVDVLVNNAGGNTDIGRQDPRTLADTKQSWLDNFTSNVIGPVLVTTALADRIADGGRVVNVSSIAARRGASGYGAAKAAIETWTTQLAGELGPHGITVNAIAPGLIEETEFFQGRLTEHRRSTLVAQTATKRAGRPDDIAALVGFLADPRSGQISGQVIPVNGGASR